MKLTPKQRELLTLIKDGGSIHCHFTPGVVDAPPAWCLMKKGDHRDLDGRTVASLDKRGFIEYVGDGDYEITKSGRAALDVAV